VDLGARATVATDPDAIKRVLKRVYRRRNLLTFLKYKEILSDFTDSLSATLLRAA
jgi:hypothetical protein